MPTSSGDHVSFVPRLASSASRMTRFLLTPSAFARLSARSRRRDGKWIVVAMNRMLFVRAICSSAKWSGDSAAVEADPKEGRLSWGRRSRKGPRVPLRLGRPFRRGRLQGPSFGRGRRMTRRRRSCSTRGLGRTAEGSSPRRRRTRSRTGSSAGASTRADADASAGPSMARSHGQWPTITADGPAITAARVHGSALTHSHSCSTPPHVPTYSADQQHEYDPHDASV
jgi:hypothetical protein